MSTYQRIKNPTNLKDEVKQTESSSVQQKKRIPGFWNAPKDLERYWTKIENSKPKLAYR